MMPFLIGLSVLIAIYFSIHVYRTGREYYWIGLMLGAPFLGSLIYFLAVYLPEMRESRLGHQVESKLRKTLNPHKALQDAEKAYKATPTVQNQLLLAKALVDSERAIEAIPLYESILAQPLYQQDKNINLHFAFALFETKQFERSKEILEQQGLTHIQENEESLLLYTKNLIFLNEKQQAVKNFELLFQQNPSLEAQICYVEALIHWNEIEKARQTLEQIEEHINLLPKHAKRLNTQWITQVNKLRQQLK